MNPTDTPKDLFDPPAEDLAGRRLRDERAKALFGAEAPEILKIKRYRLDTQLGRGGQGTVLVAHDPTLGRKVAIKRLHSTDPKREARLVEEARALARLKHDNVVRVIDVDRDDIEGAFMVLELVEGEPLDRWLATSKRTWTEIVDVFIGVAHGLSAMHSAGVVHRDVKPENIVIEESGRAKLVDLGIALVDEEGTVTQAAAETSEATKRAFAGTWGYASPEQVQGGEGDARSDQFGFCVALLRALHGRDSWAAGALYSKQAPRRRRGDGRDGTTGRIPVGLDRLLDRGLQHDPAQRFEDMETLGRGLEEIRRSRRRLVAGSAIVAGVALGSAVGWALWPTPPSPCGPDESAGDRWGEESRVAVREAFVATGGPAAESTFVVVDATLADYASALDRAREGACTTLLEGSQDAAAAYSRLACLARAEGVLVDTVEQLATSTADEVTRAPERLSALPLLAACTAPQGLAEACDPDRSIPGYESETRAIGLKLQAAEARIMLGRYDEGLELARAGIELAHADVLVPLRARAWLMHGRVAYEGQKLDEALESLDQAQSLAEQHGCDGVGAEALTLMAKVRALQLEGDPEEALRWSQQALDKLERLGDQGPRRADALNSRGLVLHQRLHRYGDADTLYKEAAQLREQYLPATALALSDTLLNRGAVLAQLDRLDDAVEVLERALELRSEALGSDHPGLYKLYVNLGNRQLERGDFEAAELALLRGSELAIAGLGARHRTVAEVDLRLAVVLDRRGRLDEGLDRVRHALEIFEATLDPQELRWMDAWGAMGQIYLDAGEPGEAVPWLTKVWELVREHPRASALERALGAFRLGAAQNAAGEPQLALPWLERSLEILGSQEGGTQASELEAHMKLELGDALVSLGRGREAVESLDGAVAWWAEHRGNPDSLAWARWILARALLAGEAGAADEDARRRADGLSRDARSAASSRSGDDAWLREIDAWRGQQGFE